MRRVLRWLAWGAAGFMAFAMPHTQAIPPAAEPVRPDPPPHWYKGNLHAHSFWSDGNDFPEMIADWYRRHGYHFLAISDHNVLLEGSKWIAVSEVQRRSKEIALARYRERFGDGWVETRTTDGVPMVRLKPLAEFRPRLEEPGRFLMIQAEEITDHFGRAPIHMNASNVRERIAPQGGRSAVEVMARNLAAAEEQGRRAGRPILTHLNHPNFGYGVTAEQLAEVRGERYFEVYNGHPDVHHLGDRRHAGVERIWDIINTLRLGEMGAPPVYGLATDDSHNYFGQSGASPGRGWIMVRSESLAPAPLIRAIEAGDFYASSGVTLREVRYTPGDGVLELEVVPEKDARYVTRFIGTLAGYDRKREPVVGAQGACLPATGRYSDDVGRVLATSEGTGARYRLTGKELYVRAVVTSSLAPDNPSFGGQKRQAWTQPVGWEKWVGRKRETASPKIAGPAEGKH